MTEIRSAFSPLFNETGFEARLDWHVSRREFAENVKRLFEELRSHKAAFPLPVPASTGTAACLLAGIDCKGCPGVCCTRSSKHVSLFPSEAVRLGVKGTPDSQGQIPLPLPCQFLRKGSARSTPSGPPTAGYTPSRPAAADRERRGRKSWLASIHTVRRLCASACVFT